MSDFAGKERASSRWSMSGDRCCDRRFISMTTELLDQPTGASVPRLTIFYVDTITWPII